jgi:hypothetical protein
MNGKKLTGKLRIPTGVFNVFLLMTIYLPIAGFSKNLVDGLFTPVSAKYFVLRPVTVGQYISIINCYY